MIYHTIANDGNGSRGYGRAVPFALGQTITLTPASLVLQQMGAGDWICGTNGAVSVVGSISGSERDWAPMRMAGMVFTVPQTRGNDHLFYVIAPTQGAVVTLYYGAVATDILVLEVGDMSSFSNVAQGSGRSVTIRSTAPVLISHTGGTSDTGTPAAASGATDYFILSPASPVAFGIPSTGWLASMQATLPDAAVSVVVACGSRRAVTTNPAVGAYTASSGSASNYNVAPCTATAAAGGLVGATSIGDSDGGDGTMWLPITALRTEFIIPMNAQHYTIGCVGAGTATEQTSKGVTRGQVSWNHVGLSQHGSCRNSAETHM